jgi:hypothetical protein
MQANTFVTGNYYKNSSREIIILVTSRTKCFINYKELWISDLNNCYQDGKVKVRVNENNDEFVLIDGFSKYSSVDEYVKYVKEEYSAVHRNFIRVGKKFKYVDLKNDILQDVIFEDTNDHGRVLNFRAINKDGNKFDCHGSLFVVTEHNRDCLKPFNYLTVEGSDLPLPTNATVNNVKEEEIKETLEDSVLPLPTNATVNNVKEEEIKETLEDSDLPLPTNATVNNVKEEEIKETLEDSNLPLPTTLLSLVIQEQVQLKETKTMFKINVTELHSEIQKKLAVKLNGVLNTSGLIDIIQVDTNPNLLDWYELEIAIYGDIDTDSDRLHQCVSWDEVQEVKKKIIKEAVIITEKNTVADELHRLNLTFEDLKNPAKLGLAGLISVPFKDKDKKYHNKLNLPQECQGLPAFSTGNIRRSQTSTHSTNRMGDSVSHKTWVTEYEYVIGTYLYWSDTNIEGKILFPSESEILKKEIDHLANILLNNGVKTLAEAQELSAKREMRKAVLEKEQQEKISRLTPEPEWVEKEITSNGNVNRFWVGDDMVVSFNWNDKDGTVWEHCDDRTRGLSNRVRTSVSIGSDRDAVMARISFLQAEASKKFAEKRARKEAYEAYKKAQEAGSRPIKSFDKWLQTTQISSSR